MPTMSLLLIIINLGEYSCYQQKASHASWGNVIRGIYQTHWNDSKGRKKLGQT